MHDRASYAKAFVGAATGNAQPINDPLGLLPEHINAITFKWNEHLIQQKISGNYLRILNTIYHQTIDFNKWEDDLAGKRLQQLTHIRYDHSNFILKRLYERNIILKRKGSFGSIVSINFDFSTWGKQYKQDEPRDANNDPCLLLAKEIQDNPIDNGIDLGLSDDIHITSIPAQKIPPADTDIPHANSEVFDSETNKVETLKAVVEQEMLRVQTEKQQALEAQISQLKQRLIHQKALEQQFSEQNHYIKTLTAQQEQQSEKLSEFQTIENESQEYILQHDKKIVELKYALQQSEQKAQGDAVEQTETITELKQTLKQSEQKTQDDAAQQTATIAELKQSLQQQQQAKQKAQEYAQQQKKIAKQAAQQNTDLQEKYALQHAEIEEYQAQITQTKTKIEATSIEPDHLDDNPFIQAEFPSTDPENQDNSPFIQAEFPSIDHNDSPFIQAEFPSDSEDPLHASTCIINTMTTSLSDTHIEQIDHHQSTFDSNQSDNNPAISDLDALHYADNISVELQNDLAILLPANTQDAQKLLDIFSAQLSNPHRSEQDPIIEFARLVQRLQTGELNIEATDTLIARARGDKTPQQCEFERLFADLEEIRHTAELNKQHYWDHYQSEADANQISVEAYIEAQDQMAFWQELCSTLKQSEYAIRDLMQHYS